MTRRHRHRRAIGRTLLGAAVGVVCIVLTIGRARAEEKDDTSTAVIALHRAFKNAPTKADGELAQFHLAVSLYRLRLHRAAFGIFSDIADHPEHVRFSATLLWLSKLATDLPAPADVGERVGRYDGAEVAKLDNPSQREVFWHVNFMLGRLKVQSRQYEEAARRFEDVPPGSKYYLQSQFFTGLSSVMLRRPTDAIQAFERIVRQIDSQRDRVEVEDPDRMRALAVLSIARTYYSTSVRFDEDGTPQIDRARVGAAIKHWDAVDEASEYWLDALLEQAWGYFMTREHARALGNLRMVQLEIFPMAYRPEADLLRSVIYLANCQYEDAATLTARFHEKYQPIEKELSGVFRSHRDQGDEAFHRLLRDVRDGKANLSPGVRLVVVNALGDRELLRHLQYVQVLDDERKRFGKMDLELRESALGNDVRDALELARELAVQNAGRLARERIQRALDELGGYIRTNTRLLESALAGRRGAPDVVLAPWRVPPGNPGGTARTDDAHVLWPFTGEFWRDEGHYQESIRGRCR